MNSKQPIAIVRVSEKWRLTLEEAAELCGLSRATVRDLEKAGRFPPRTHVPIHGAGEENRKLQFIAAEVHAWANGEDWNGLVRKRLELEQRAHAS